MAGSKDTQEEKPQLDSVEDQYKMMDWPRCLNLDVLSMQRWAQSTEDPKNNVVLSCTKVTKDKGPGEPEEEPRCPRYSCTSGSTRRNCSGINFSPTYYVIPCPKEGQELQRESLKCWAQSTEYFKSIDLCCPPEVLKNVTLKDTEGEPRAPEKQQFSIKDPQETVGDHQTPKTPRDHQTSRRKLRSSQERRNLAYPTPVWDRPTPTHILLCLSTTINKLYPQLGRESSQEWVAAIGSLGSLVFLVFLVLLVLRWGRGWGETRCLRKKALRVEEGLGEKQDRDGGTPGK